MSICSVLYVPEGVFLQIHKSSPAELKQTHIRYKRAMSYLFLYWNGSASVTNRGHNLKQTRSALHKQSNPQNNSLSYKGGTSLWFPLHLQEYCYFTVGEFVFLRNRSHFSRSWWLPGFLFPRLATFPYQISFVKHSLVWLCITSRVCLCAEGQSQGCVLKLVGSQHSSAWHEVAESKPSCKQGLMRDLPPLSGEEWLQA